MELADVRAFVRVVDKGSVSAAARDLHITQSAVTKRLQRLEISLGARLVDRTQRPIALTRMGQSALERCRRLLNDVNDLRAAVSGGDSTPAELRIGVAHALGEVALTEPLGRVREKFPRLGLRLATGWSSDLLERVRSGALDAAIIVLPEAERLPSEVVGTIVGKERLLILGARQKERGALAVQDLKGAQWILNPEGCGARAMLRRTLARADVDMQVAIESYDYELQLLLTAEGRGLTLVPERVFLRSPLKSRLRALQIVGLHFPFKNVWSLQRASAELEPVFSTLNQLLMRRLQKRPVSRHQALFGRTTTS
jgi:DNA-binding transcriptional LysR family regulator